MKLIIHFPKGDVEFDVKRKRIYGDGIEWMKFCILMFDAAKEEKGKIGTGLQIYFYWDGEVLVAEAYCKGGSAVPEPKGGILGVLEVQGRHSTSVLRRRVRSIYGGQTTGLAHIPG